MKLNFFNRSIYLFSPQAYIFCGSILISYAAAALFSIAIEYPCASLEKLMLRSRQDSTEDDKSHQNSGPSSNWATALHNNSSISLLWKEYVVNRLGQGGCSSLQLFNESSTIERICFVNRLKQMDETPSINLNSKIMHNKRLILVSLCIRVIVGIHRSYGCLFSSRFLNSETMHNKKLI